MPNEFGNVLKPLRRDLGLSQAGLADALNSTQRHISFLETGRSQPSRAMIGRMATELRLTAGQKASLFNASGFRNPYKRRSFSSQEVTEALDMIEHRVLAHWPFPAFVMDAEWAVLRMNTPAKTMFSPYLAKADGQLNMFSVFFSDTFHSQIENWPEVSSSVFYRMLSAAARSETLRVEFEKARKSGMFDQIVSTLTHTNEIPIFVPVILKLPNGARLKLTSLLGQLVSVHDALVEGFEVEFMIPTDAESEVLLTSLGGQ